jgi:predicted dehydrogenase
VASKAKNAVSVVVVGSGRMGSIRSELAYANPRLKLCGVVDINMEGAISLADRFGVCAT